MSHFVTCNTTDTARDLAKIFNLWVVRLHGPLKEITLDRGSTFASAWWGEYCKATGIDPKLSTAFHPQMDGQTERTNQSVGHIPRVTDPDSFCPVLISHLTVVLGRGQSSFLSPYGPVGLVM